MYKMAIRAGKYKTIAEVVTKFWTHRRRFDHVSQNPRFPYGVFGFPSGKIDVRARVAKDFHSRKRLFGLTVSRENISLKM